MSLSPTPKTRLIHIANIAWAKSTITVIITLKSAYSQKWLRNAESRGDVAGGAIRAKYSDVDEMHLGVGFKPVNQASQANRCCFGSSMI
jgi:hypothetical protein